MLRVGLVASLVVSSLVVSSVASAEPTATSKVVGRSGPRSELYRISETGVHYAVITPKGAKSVIVVDGVEGPEFDRFLDRRGRVGELSNVNVVFSSDGTRHAYLAEVGQEYILVVDGKVIARGPHGPSNLSYSDMSFSPAGKHVYFVDLRPEGGQAKAQLVMDGKPGPFTGHQNMFPVFSPDDSHWAYNAVKFGGKGQTDLFTVVDGNEVPYIGMDPMFTADNKLVTPPAGVATGGKLGPAPKGSRWAGVVQPVKPGGPRILYVDGKAVAGAENCDEVVWSPDGKRYMATCSNNAAFSKYVVLDGTQGPEYQAIVPGLTKFSADSSRAIYVGSDKLGKRYVVVDGAASGAITALLGQTNPIVTAKGGRFAYLASDGTVITLILDGKPVDLAGKQPMPGSLGFTADGARFAFAAQKPGAPPKRVLVVDGVELAGVSLADIPMPQMVESWWTGRYGPQFKYYQFSPDGKHVATYGSGDAGIKSTVFVDGKPLVVEAPRTNALYLSWSPDSKHVFWSGAEQIGANPVYRVFVDGKASPVTYTGTQPAYPGTWEIGADSALSILVFEGADAKRYRVMPDPAVTIDTVLAAVK